MKKEDITYYIALYLAVPSDKVIASADLAADLGADSLDLVELTMGLEAVFNVEISDATAQEFKTVQDIYSFFNLADDIPLLLLYQKKAVDCKALYGADSLCRIINVGCNFSDCPFVHWRKDA